MEREEGRKKGRRSGSGLWCERRGRRRKERREEDESERKDWKDRWRGTSKRKEGGRKMKVREMTGRKRGQRKELSNSVA